MSNRLRELRKQHGVTQDELASAVGVTRQTILALENGRYDASLRLARKLSCYFCVTIEELFFPEEEQTEEIRQKGE